MLDPSEDLKKEKANILLVDDEEHNLITYRRILERAGYSIQTAKTRNEALGIIDSKLPDLILMDVLLHNDSGIDLMKLLRKDGRLEHSYMVLISSKQISADDQATGLETGADGYIVRPLTQRELLARIEVFLRHKKTLDQLRRSEARFRKIILKNPDALLILDQDGYILFANPAAQSMFDFPDDKLIGSHFGYPLVDNLSSEIQLVRSNDDPGIGEMRVIEIEWNELRSYLTSVRDISLRKKVESMLQQSEEKYKSIINSVPLSMIIWREVNQKFVMEECNHETCRMSGLDRTQLVGEQAVQHYVHLPEVLESLKNCLYFMSSFEQEMKFRDPVSGKDRIQRLLFSHVPDNMVMVITEDLTERKRLELRVRAERDKASQYLNIAASIILTLDKKGDITLLNDDGAKILECQKQRVIGMNWFDHFLDPSIVPEIKELFRKVMSGDLSNTEYHENEVITLKGNRRTIRWRNSLLKNELGQTVGILSSGEDITEKQQALKNLKNSELRYRELFNRMQNGVLILEHEDMTRDFSLKDANHAAARILGLDLLKMQGKPVRQVLPGLETMGLWDVIRQVFQTGKPEIQLRARYQDERKEFFAENHLYKLPAGDIVVVFNDISKRVQSEFKLMKSMEEISKLTARVVSVREEERKDLSGHIHDDLGQLLTALKMDLSWISNHLPKDGDRKLKDRIHSAIRIVDDSVRSVQQISTQLRPPVLDHLGLGEALQDYVTRFGERTEIRTFLSISPEHPELHPDLSLALFRVIQEALTNVARHAGAKNIQISLTVSDSVVEMEIWDDGNGISDEQIDSSDSLGIIGMRERISSWNGTFNISRKNARGTRIQILVPVVAP